MRSLLADTDLERLSTCIAKHMGLLFPPPKWRTLEQQFCTAARELGFGDVHECVAQFTAAAPSKELIESLASYLTIGETYFLREIRCFEILERQIIPEIVKTRQGGEQHLRIWCAGCATGEEPYSVAILLHRMRTTLRGWDISILATDINPNSLRKAQKGIYSNWSFRTSPPWFKDFFRQTADKQYELFPHIREMVKFSSINLVEDCYPSLITDTNAIDVIFCRNVLMYFTPHVAAKVVERFHRSLLDGGWLFVSPCETSNSFLSGFDPVYFPDATLYQKRSNKVKSSESVVWRNGATEQVINLSFIHPLTVSPSQEVSQNLRHPHAPAQNLDSPVPPPAHPPQEQFTDQKAVPPYRAALTLYEHGAYREAADIVTGHLLTDRNDSQALALLCRIYANQGKLAEALGASDRALAAEKLSAGLHYLRAVILQEQGKYDEAATSLKKALYLDQDMVLAHFTLANLEQRQGKVKESQRHFNNALSLLERYRPDDVIPESDGMLAARLKEIIRATIVRM